MLTKKVLIGKIPTDIEGGDFVEDIGLQRLVPAIALSVMLETSF